MTDPTKDQARERARELAKESLEHGDAVGWFDRFYRDAGGVEGRIPWADLRGHPLLVEWLARHGGGAKDRRALVVGCGLGEDCETLSTAGFRVTGFDVSPTAVEWCRKRFPKSRVEYVAADLFHAPKEWKRAFDFVFELYTLQALPHEPRTQAIERIAEFVAPGGELLVITRARDPHDDPGQLPWPLIKSEVVAFMAYGLREVEFEDLPQAGDPPTRHFRALYRAT